MTGDRYLDTVDTTEKDVWEVTLKVQGNPVKVDTGAEVTALSESAWNSLGLSVPLRKAETSLFRPDRSQLKVFGILSHKNNSCTQPIYIIKELKSNLLGLPAIKDLKLLLNMCSIDKSITSEYPSLFTGLGTFAQYTIKLKPNHQPFTVCSSKHAHTTEK